MNEEPSILREGASDGCKSSTEPIHDEISRTWLEGCWTSIWFLCKAGDFQPRWNNWTMDIVWLSGDFASSLWASHLQFTDWSFYSLELVGPSLLAPDGVCCTLCLVDISQVGGDDAGCLWLITARTRLICATSSSYTHAGPCLSSCSRSQEWSCGRRKLYYRT